MNTYPTQWNYLLSAWQQKRNAHALLFVGALDRHLLEFTHHYKQLIFCKNQTIAPCHTCNDCQMSFNEQHPDVEWIRPEKSNGPIKIDQIRELQNYSYLTPQRATHRLIIIESADRMNTAAANALLKILEEPAPHTLFLLLAQQLSTVLPTVLSRCQVLRFAPSMDLSLLNFATLAEQYSHDSEQMTILNQAETILDGLIGLIEKELHPCAMASQWTKFELSNLLWFLYLVYSQTQMLLTKQIAQTEEVNTQLMRLAALLTPVKIFSQIDKINTLQRKLSHNMNVNHTLVLEDLLFDL